MPIKTRSISTPIELCYAIKSAYKQNSWWGVFSQRRINVVFQALHDVATTTSLTYKERYELQYTKLAAFITKEELKSWPDATYLKVLRAYYDSLLESKIPQSKSPISLDTKNSLECHAFTKRKKAWQNLLKQEGQNTAIDINSFLERFDVAADHVSIQDHPGRSLALYQSLIAVHQQLLAKKCNVMSCQKLINKIKISLAPWEKIISGDEWQELTELSALCDDANRPKHYIERIQIYADSVLNILENTAEKVLQRYNKCTNAQKIVVMQLKSCEVSSVVLLRLLEENRIGEIITPKQIKAIQALSAKSFEVISGVLTPKSGAGIKNSISRLVKNMTPPASTADNSTQKNNPPSSGSFASISSMSSVSSCYHKVKNSFNLSFLRNFISSKTAVRQ